MSPLKHVHILFQRFHVHRYAFLYLRGVEHQSWSLLSMLHCHRTRYVPYMVCCLTCLIRYATLYIGVSQLLHAFAMKLIIFMISIFLGYISRSVAGSYDNEGIAIFALMFTYFLWLRSLNTGSVFWATACSLSYFYMVGGASTEV